MKVSVVIPNWNGRELLEKNLPKVIAAKKNAVNNIAEIVVIDDKSTDDSVKLLEKTFAKEIKIVRHTKNRGFSSAVNTGVRSSKSALICLLNTDVIPEPDFLKALHQDFDDEKVFSVSLHEKGYGPAAGKFNRGFVEFNGLPEYKTATESFWASGGSAVFRRTIWMKLKGLDEKVLSPLYWEDIDISYRAQKRGYKILWEPKAKVNHKHESTVSKLSRKYVNRIRERNQLLFIWKNITSGILIRKHIRGLFVRMFRHPGYIRIFFMALSRYKDVSVARRKEKKEAKISDEALFAKWNSQ